MIMESVEVAIPVPVNRTFSYLIPEGLKDLIKSGVRVKVPFKNRVLIGYVLDIKKNDTSMVLKEIVDVLDTEPLFHKNMVRFLRQISHEYLTSIGEVLRHALPGGLNTIPYRVGYITQKGNEYLESIKRDNPQINYLRWVRDNPGKRLPAPLHIAYQLKRFGFIELKEKGTKARRIDTFRRFVRFKRGIDARALIQGIIASPGRAKNESDFLEFIYKKGEVARSSLVKSFSNGQYLIRKWIKRGALEYIERPFLRDYTPSLIQYMPEPESLYPQQQDAINIIEKNIQRGNFSVHLIHGVAGSGKTEVYFEAIRSAIKMGKKAILLVPEIALSNYMAGIFASRLGKRVAVYHSGLSYGERYAQWMRMARDEVDLVIGARSSIFAPFSRVGLIIMDEEHDPSYKQEEGIRYNVRDLALMRAKQEGAVLVMGSATPSVESYYHAKEHRYILLNMPERIQERPMPEVMIVDMKKQKSMNDGAGIISAPLCEEIKSALDNGKQVMLFLNRRGYIRVHLCVLCGKALRCINCDVALVHHLERGRVLCHYCGYSIPVPDTCPYCGQRGLKRYGYGTEKVEGLIHELFPHARIARMDRDSVRKKGASVRLLRNFHQKEIDIIVGTQMITKGYHFPDVTLVGILAADLSLNFPDFRAGERTFQLLSQAAGRSGRGTERGKVIIQTFNPEHYTITNASRHKFMEFFQKEISLRKTLGYPPFVEMALIRVEGNRMDIVSRKAEEISRLMSELNSGWFKGDNKISVLGPVEAPIFRLRGKYRYQILIKAKHRDALLEYLGRIKEDVNGLLRRSGVSMVIDFSP